MESRQRGMTLLEVLLAVSVLAVGLLGAAALQVQGLQASEGARRDGQAVRLAQTLLERSRGAGALASAGVDEWQQALRRVLGDSAEGQAVQTGARVSVEIRWRDTRGGEWQRVSLQGELP